MKMVEVESCEVNLSLFIPVQLINSHRIEMVRSTIIARATDGKSSLLLSS